MQKIKNILRSWLPAAVIITALCGLVYLAVQQALRISANDPQIQMAEDTAAALSAGQSAAALVPSAKVDIGQSLAPFIMVFDPSGAVSASSAQLHGQNPALPAGVLDDVKQKGEDRISWQPEPGVRIAAVIVPVANGSGYVLAGRSLREVEKRIDQLGTISGLAWLLTMAASLIVVFLCEILLSSRPA
jgi:hypothetical protein